MTKVTLEKAQHLLGEAKFQAYACLDTTGTREIFDNLIGKLDPERAKLYHWVRAQQGPALTMTLRGVALDKAALGEARSEVARELAKVIEAIQNNEHVRRVWDEVELNTGDCPHRPPRKSKKTGKESPGKHLWEQAPRGMPKLDPRNVKCRLCGAPRVIPKEFKPTSDDAVKKLLYEKFKAPKIFGKTGSLTADGDALDKLILKGQRAKKWEFLIEVCELLKKVRDLAKQQGFLFAKIDENTPHPRYYSSFNVGAAWTGRFSSSQDPFKYGGNLQNIAEKNRHIFVPDPRYKMFYADLKTAESLLVAYTSGEEKYIEAHKGDVHTYVCREVWPELPWTGDIKQDKIIATSNYPPWDPAPGHDYRFQSKRVQHGCLPGYAQVLTPKGWKRIALVEDGEPIAVWHPDGRIAWEVPYYWMRFKYKGELYRFQGRNIVQDVTREHRMPLFNNGKLGERFAWQMRGTRYGRYPVSGILPGAAKITEIEARLLAATWADGFHPSGYQQTRFGFNKQRKVERLKTLLEKAGLSYREYVPPSRREHTIIFVRAVLRKHLDWDMLDWPLDARQAFLDELPHWDGHVNPATGQARVFQANKKDIEIIATLAHVSGMAAGVYKHGTPRDNEQQCWTVGLHKRQWGDYASVGLKIEPCHEMVFCPSVSSGWFLVKQDDVISVTGNSNYGLTPFGMAMIAHIPVEAAREAQQRYFRAFPGIQEWQRYIIGRVERQLPLRNPFGRVIRLIGRPRDPHTHKQGLAFGPQSGIAELLNAALWRVWSRFDPELIQVLAQVHDAILGQYLEEREDEALRALKECMEMSFPVTDIHGVTRICTIPVEIAVGYNWGKASESNPNGLKEVKGPFR